MQKTSVGGVYDYYVELTDTSKPHDIKKLQTMNNNIVSKTVIEETYKKVHSIFLNTSISISLLNYGSTIFIEILSESKFSLFVFSFIKLESFFRFTYFS